MVFVCFFHVRVKTYIPNNYLAIRIYQRGYRGIRRKNIMRLTVFLTGLFAAAILFMANGQFAHAQEQPAATNTNETTVTQPVIVEVKKGDSLSKIAKNQATTYTRIFDANTEVSDPNVIYPGQKLRIPDASEQLVARTAAVVSAPVAQATPKKAAAPKQKATTSKPKQKTAPSKAQSAPANAVSGNVWDQLARCESGGNWAINTGNGYYGGLQFTAATWKAVGGSGLPHQASREEQIMRGQILQARSGWGQWPACTKKLGLR